MGASVMKTFSSGRIKKLMLELNRLYNMDCMEGMKQFPDRYFDLAVVDPPYGVGSITYMPHRREDAICGFIDTYKIVIATLDVNNRPKLKTNIAHSQCNSKTLMKFGDENVSPPPEYFKELFRVSKKQIIFGGNYFLLPPSRGFIVWDKGRSEKFSMAMAEFIWTSFNTNSKIWKGQSELPGSSCDPRFHPTQKPVALYNWILKHYAKPGDKILDTHAGSASSLIACHKAGHDFIGFELDPDYCRMATERLEREKKQLNLFQ